MQSTKTVWWILGGIVLVLLGIWFWTSRMVVPAPQNPNTINEVVINTPEKASYIVDGRVVSLSGAGAVTPFGQAVYGDLNSDGVDDAVILFTMSPGGSGTFYYIAGSIKTGADFKGTNAILLGDRIAPQNIEIIRGVIIADYAIRKAGEPMTTAPSIAVSKYFRVINGVLTEIPNPIK